MRQWYIVHRSGKRLSAAGRAFEQFVRQEAERFVRVAMPPGETVAPPSAPGAGPA
jgi:hypothetical protein